MAATQKNLELAPELQTSKWFNSDHAFTLETLRGRVVVLVAFQMLCPSCVATTIPLAKRIDQTFDVTELAVVGLHTVFEHHDVMTPQALEVFLSEYRVSFPIGVDTPDPKGGTIPMTMRAYGMQGTPTLVLIDSEGHRRAQHFGLHDELVLGAEIGLLLAERRRLKGNDEGR